MRKVSVILWVLVTLACGQRKLYGPGFYTIDSLNLIKNLGPCDREVMPKPSVQYPRHVAFYELYKAVNSCRESLNSKTFKVLEGGQKPVFNFPISEIFPVYKDADFIYEGLGYNNEAINSLEIILNKLNLKINLFNRDLIKTSKLLGYLSDTASLLKTLVNEKLREATLEKLRFSKTNEDLNKIVAYFQAAVVGRDRLISELSSALMFIASTSFSRDVILENLTNNIVGESNVLRRGDYIDPHIFSSRYTPRLEKIMLYYSIMKSRVEIVSCFVDNI
ncbi:hypothetical protein baBA2_000929 (plasmid) [Borrelia anserina]|uniref:Lipoprotein n=1 Tax=Borrelia anserina Es TaxID=1365188 RepID=A0ABN4UDE9_BORAN|nr:hypothetical protein [Borrelia anserina]APR65335.1 hypothetical protein N187_A16 [Borrelia anserina Es]UPA07303.1 hypothetical protein baBA2_000929 [Borrelia anserina]